MKRTIRFISAIMSVVMIIGILASASILPVFAAQTEEGTQKLEKNKDYYLENYLNKPYYRRATPYEETEKNQIIVDYIASMTDDYFIDLYKHLVPNGKHEIHYKGYFD